MDWLPPTLHPPGIQPPKLDMCSDREWSWRPLGSWVDQRSVPAPAEIALSNVVCESFLSGDSVRTEEEQNPQAGIGLDHVHAVDEPPTHVPETQALTRRPKRRGAQNARGAPKRKRGSTPIPQEEPQGAAVPLKNGQVPGQHESHSDSASDSVEPAGHPVGQESGRHLLRYECQDCGRSFTYRSQLDLHRRSHTGERPFQCPDCPKRFIQASDLHVHHRIHTGEKPYRCATCEKDFTHKSTLRGHQRVHTQETPYQCEVCHQRFSHRGNLSVHMRIHSGLRPYRCPHCDRTFRQLGTFKRHQNTCQGGSPEAPVPSGL